MLNWDQVKNIISLIEKDESEKRKYSWSFNQHEIIMERSFKSEKYSVDVAHQRGGEGQGEDWEIVYKFTDHELNDFAYVIYPGYYSSWNDGEVELFIHEAKIVTPIEKQITVTVWETVENA